MTSNAAANPIPGRTTAELSQLNQTEFIAALDGIFEHSPWVAERAWLHRPFASREALLQSLLDAMLHAERPLQLALICAHPELAGKAAIRGELTVESTQEQASAGLNACTPEEYAEIQQLNAAYRERFGFPFIVAVRGMSRGEIIAAMRLRVARHAEEEFAESLRQIGRIASLRLEMAVA
ncbi:2-oxo-4-hydroxy-4-carboxy-5-ureidoimidazoline decarboxylase [Andreprevotia chitinilytica]|uniref:2-oxo-4-hydroxy-4-carboxy-5-ureidoimidazoline decarboxylase n=1 Tax=Andreprevotia chitinilytica TaxID=396808 RepID=UPI00068B1D98|nr:2-oxo-4-hydroxy-4-carboxy-5-ureidoimidazoline decarboxylase [Andreprevotia chitinilytica]